MSKQIEALKLAQDWYDSGNENPDDFANMIKQVIALAEQPAQKPPKWQGALFESALQAEFAEHRDEYKAATELRRLHEVNQELLRLVKRYRAETPLGHQPHMIAHEADAAVAKAGETK